MSNNEYSQDPWRMFRIISEFVDGFQTMESLGPAVTFFGSARECIKNTPYYELARVLGYELAKKGFAVLTGGNFGIMEAANMGAKQASGKSAGLCIDLPKERPNSYLDHEYTLRLRYFFVRKVLFLKYAQGFIAFPGGFGTLDEFFECLTLIQTGKSKAFPIYLVGKEYWQGLFDWMRKTSLSYGTLSEVDFNLFTLTDDPKEIIDGIEQHYIKLKLPYNL